MNLIQNYCSDKWIDIKRSDGQKEMKGMDEFMGEGRSMDGWIQICLERLFPMGPRLKINTVSGIFAGMGVRLPVKRVCAYNSDLCEKFIRGSMTVRKSKAEQSRFKASIPMLYFYIWLACLQA